MTEVFDRLRSTRGLVATCVLSGSVEEEYAAAHEEMRAFNIEHGFKAVEYRRFHCVLVESGRDAVVEHALREKYDWVLQIDADAAPFPPDALVRLLKRAYIDVPDADAVGAYAQLRQVPYLPTIDTGSGTWEEHYPGDGLLKVTRTGGHFLLTKTSAYRRFPPPWHRSRIASAPIEAIITFDSFVRGRLGGRNPFTALPEWETILKDARESSPGDSTVGEDSGFCDRLYAAGGSIYVDTDLVAGHILRLSITPEMMREKLDARRRSAALACGVTQ